MKTKNVILIAAIVLQTSIVFGALVAQESVIENPVNKEQKIKKMIKSAPKFLNPNSAVSLNTSDENSNDQVVLQQWMLNPEEWSNDNSIEWVAESLDPEVKLEDWMLDPVAMINNNNSQEESVDSTIELKEWMLNPSAMSAKNEITEIDSDIQLEPWMLDPTKW